MLPLPKFVLLVPLAFPTAAVAYGNEDHQLNRVWSRMADLRGEFGSVESAEFSRDSRFIVTGTKYDNTVRVFRTTDGVMQWETELPAEIERVAWSGNGSQVVSVSEDHFMRVLDAQTGEIVKEIKQGNGMDSLALSNDGKIMAVGEEMKGDGGGKVVENSTPVILYDAETWQEIRRVNQRATANEISFAPDDSFFVVVGGNRLRIWETATGREIATTVPQGDPSRPVENRFISAIVAPDGKHMAVGAQQGWVYLFTTPSGKFVRRFNKTGDKIETVEWTKDGKYILSAGKGNKIDFIAAEYALDKKFDNNSLPIGLRIHVTDQLEYMNFNRDGSLLTTAHQDGTVQLWTYMSDNPGINQRSHARLKRQQDRKFGK
ncbi:MAG: PQQ-binding-like beta-propeller repeat protein [Planctomycetota bacterium]